MSKFDNYPYALAVLQVKLRSQSLQINKLLTKVTEVAVVSALLVFADSKDLRTPITKPRVVIGKMSGLGRTALYKTLSELKEMGLISGSEGQQSLSFTDKAVSLMVDVFPVIQKAKSDFFNHEGKWIPRDAIPLLNKGLKGIDIVKAMSFAKKNKVRIQDIIRNFKHVLEKYEGKVLISILMAIIKNPEQYVQKAEECIPGNTGAMNDFSAYERQVANFLTTEHANGIFMPGETLKRKQGRYYVTGKASTGRAKARLAESADIRSLLSRVKLLCETAAKTREVSFLDDGRTVVWDGEQNDKGNPVVNVGGEKITTAWPAIFAHLKASERVFQGDTSDLAPMPKSIRLKGLEWVVDQVESGRAWISTYIKGIRQTQIVDAKMIPSVGN